MVEKDNYKFENTEKITESVRISKLIKAVWPEGPYSRDKWEIMEDSQKWHELKVIPPGGQDLHLEVLIDIRDYLCKIEDHLDSIQMNQNNE
jgi:hypothetical protein